MPQPDKWNMDFFASFYGSSTCRIQGAQLPQAETMAAGLNSIEGVHEGFMEPVCWLGSNSSFQEIITFDEIARAQAA